MLVRSLVKHALGVSALLCVCTCYAQQAQVPFEQIQQDAKASLVRAALNSDPASAPAIGATPGVSSSAAPAFSPAPASSAAEFNSMPVARSPKVVDSKYLWVNGLDLGLAVTDVAMSQRCIDQHTCVEANPLMPSSLAGKFGVDLGAVAYAAGVSYYMKKHKSSWWWLAPLAGASFHSGGIASAIAH
jgi:hypothetical protein